MLRKVIIAFLMIFSVARAAEKVYVPFFNSENVSRQTAMSATYMLSDYINEEGAFVAIPAEKRDTIEFEANTSEVLESAELLGTSYYTMGRIIRLGSIYHISLDLYTSSGGLKVWSGTSVASGLDQFPIVLKGLAHNMGVKGKCSQPGDIYMLSDDDTKRVGRIKSNKSIGAMASGMLPLSGKKVNNINGGFGLLGSFDTRSYILQISGEVIYGNDSVPSATVGGRFKNRYYNLGMNVLYPLATTNNAPFVCLGSSFTYRETVIRISPARFGAPPFSSREEDHVDTGLTLSGGGGYILRRNADATLFIYGKGYLYMPAVDQMAYGASLTLALTAGW